MLQGFLTVTRKEPFPSADWFLSNSTLSLSTTFSSPLQGKEFRISSAARQACVAQILAIATRASDCEMVFCVIKIFPLLFLVFNILQLVIIDAGAGFGEIISNARHVDVFWFSKIAIAKFLLLNCYLA